MPRVREVKLTVRRYTPVERKWTTSERRFHVETEIGAIFRDPKVVDMVIGTKDGGFVGYQRPLGLPVAGRG